MNRNIERLMRDCCSVRINRRNFLLSLPALAAAYRAMAQSGKPTIPLQKLNHVTLSVSDPRRSLEFYQGLFGLPIQNRQGKNSVGGLRIGSGPQNLALAPAGANTKPGINHFCLTTRGFDVDRILKVLAEHGITKYDPSGGGSAQAPLKARVRIRGEDLGGAKQGTPEFYFTDLDGIVVQLQDTSYCGGAGVLGNVCLATPEPAPSKGLLTLRDYSHVTLAVSSQQRSVEFYRELFGLPIQAYQGKSPVLAIGSGPQFLALAEGQPPGAAPGIPSIAHVCFTINGFNPDKVQKALADYGVKPRGSATGPVAPLTYYVRMRMEEQGGAKGGTPELYFTDPDGIVIQLQDASYCGGSGYLGNVCR